MTACNPLIPCLVCPNMRSCLSQSVVIAVLLTVFIFMPLDLWAAGMI
jgi:hypothetical protein